MRSEIPRSSAASRCVVPEGVEVRAKTEDECEILSRDCEGYSEAKQEFVD